jgi:hypothetical protein
MDLSQLVASPKLVLVTLKDIELPKLDADGNRILDKKTGEPVTYKDTITFWTPDRQPLNIYLKLSQAIGKDQDESIELIKGLILDKDGNKVIVGDKVPPVAVMVAAMTKVMELLGK